MSRASPGVLSLLPGDAVSEHSIDTPSGKLAYTATAGTFSLFDQSAERSAAIFYTAYVVKTDNHAARPLTFVSNGGPGAASAFLHLGLVGPRLAQFGMSGHDGADVRLVDNPDTWLSFTDLVLIDPVGTGRSRPAKPDGGSAFWGVRAMPSRWRRRSRFTSRKTGASVRRNSSSAKATAAFAPPRSPARCSASRAS